jgi:GT2 family glycosyltransferase
VARGAFLAFTDDDCYPDLAWLTEARRAFAAHPDAGVVGGRIVLFDPTDARVTIQEHDRLERLAPRSFIEPGFIQGANFVVRREVFDAVEGFDRNFGPGTFFNCEDVSLICRASFAGFAVVYDPGLVVHHHHGRKPGPAVTRQWRSYAYGRGAYYANFLLRTGSRVVFLKNLYWKWNDRRYRAQAGERLRELLGGVGFLLMSIRRFGQNPYRLD